MLDHHSLTTKRYQISVRLGNWYETKELQEDNQRALSQALRNGELISQKADRFNKILHQPAILTKQYEVAFGSIVQLVPTEMELCDTPTKNLYSALALTGHERAIRVPGPYLSPECDVVVMSCAESYVRNSFQIVSADQHNRSGSILKYGDRFRLKCLCKESSLYLYSGPNSAGLSPLTNTMHFTTHHGENNLTMGAIYRKDIGPGKMLPTAYLDFFCQPADKKMYLRLMGKNIAVNTPLVITHSVTNRSLACEDSVSGSLYGLEHMVSLTNYKGKDFKKNVWILHDGTTHGRPRILGAGETKEKDCSPA